MGVPERQEVRAFLAVAVPEDVRGAAAGLMESARGAVEGVRWVEPRNLHVTVKFLGQAAAGTLDGIGRRLRARLAEVSRFRASFRGVGAFPSLNRPRVVFVEMEGGREEMAALIRLVEREVEPLGFLPESREQSPHLTLGRIRQIRSPGRLAEWARGQAGRELGSMMVSEVVLMKSDLRPSGPVYTVLEAYPLGGRGAVEQGA